MKKQVFIILLFAVCATQKTQAQNIGSIEGEVSDPTHASIDGATVVAQDAAGQPICEVRTDANGHFACAALPLGTYRVVISARAFSAETPSAVTTKGDPSAHVTVALALSSESTSVTVSASQHEIATEQIHAAEGTQS